MATRLTSSLIRSWLPKRRRDAHKGGCGRILIVAGSRGMSGSAVLSALGAVKAGAGLVKVATVKSQQGIVARRAPLEVTSAGLPETTDGTLSLRAWDALKKIIEQFNPDVVAAGPGLGVSSSVRRVIINLIHRTELPLVLDADGLNVLRIDDLVRKMKNTIVITPHAGELGKLMKIPVRVLHSCREASSMAASKKCRVVCVLKGSGTVVANGEKIWINTTGNSAMASAGMGDVLTGAAAALWGQSMGMPGAAAEPSVCSAIFLHGLAGDRAKQREGGLSVQASSVANYLPWAISVVNKGGKR